MKPLVCIIAHPDDEAFGPAGSIAHFSRLRAVHILCATSGDADSKFTKHESSQLGKIREKELRASARILGVTSVVFLGFHDGTLCNNSYHDLAESIQRKLEELRPDTILTFDTNGISGHIDHIVVSLVTTFVFNKLGYVKTLLYYTERKEWMDAFMVDIGQYFVYVPPGRIRSDIGLTIDTKKYWEIRVKAMDAHVSQKSDAEWLKRVLAKLPKEEHFLVLEKKL